MCNNKLYRVFLLIMAARLGPWPIRRNRVATFLDIVNRSVFVIQTSMFTARYEISFSLQFDQFHASEN